MISKRVYVAKQKYVAVFST